MAKLTDLEKVRRQRQRRRVVRNLLVLSLFAVIVLGGMQAVGHVGDLDIKTAYSDIKAEITTGAGFPISLPGGKIAHIDVFDNGVSLLSDTNIYAYNASGRQILNVQHGMIQGDVVTASDRMLLYDRGGNQLSLYSKSALLHTLTTDYKIYTADLSRNGNYAVATSSREYTAHVAVYNRSNQDIFNWYSSQKPVVSVALSDEKEEMLVGCVDVSGGDYLSSISRFRFSVNEELNRVEFPDELLLAIDYQSDTRVRALTDRRIVLLNQDLEEVASYEFQGEKISRISEQQGGLLAVVLGSYAEDKKQTVVLLDGELIQLGKFSIDRETQELACDSSHVYLALQNQLEVYAPDGSKLVQKQIKGIQKMGLADGVLYYVTPMELGKLSVEELLAPAQTESSSAPSASQNTFNRREAVKSGSDVPDELDGSGVESEQGHESLLEPDAPAKTNVRSAV